MSTIVIVRFVVCIGSIAAALPGRAQPATLPQTQPAQRRLPPAPANLRTRESRQQTDYWNIGFQNIPERGRPMRFQSALVNQSVSYVVVLPPDYEKNRATRYPVIYWLGPLTGDCRNIGPMAASFYDAMAAGTCPPVIVVSVHGVFGSMYTDSHDRQRPIQSVIINELIPHIDNTLRTLPNRENRAIEGFSMGGFGAALLATKHPELFGSLSILSGELGSLKHFQSDAPDFSLDVWGNDQAHFDANDPWLLVAKNVDQIRGKMRIRIFAGSKDRFKVLNEDFHLRLLELGIDHEFAVAEGAKHDLGLILGGLKSRIFAFWKEAFQPTPKLDAPTSRPKGDFHL